MPRARASAHISFTGRIAPLPVITWEIASTRVREFSALRNTSITSEALSAGLGIWTVCTLPP